MCSSAFVFECKEGQGRTVGHFPEQPEVVNTYRGELLGLLVIHLILLAVNMVEPDLSGQVEIFSDCLGALRKTSTLSATWITKKCR